LPQVWSKDETLLFSVTWALVYFLYLQFFVCEWHHHLVVEVLLVVVF
jgi:hypothetical protein